MTQTLAGVIADTAPVIQAALLIKNMNLVGAVREPPLQETCVPANHVCIQQCHPGNQQNVAIDLSQGSGTGSLTSASVAFFYSLVLLLDVVAKLLTHPNLQ